MSAPPSTPPLPALLDILSALTRADIRASLGASALLHALGLCETVRDWDLTTDAPADRVRAALDRFDFETIGPNSIFETEAMFRVRHAGASIDVMCRFAIRHESGIFVVPTEPAGEWHGVPLASAAAWAAAYAIMGREERAALLFRHLAARGVACDEFERLLLLSLPERVLRRLDAVITG